MLTIRKENQKEKMIEDNKIDKPNMAHAEKEADEILQMIRERKQTGKRYVDSQIDAGMFTESDQSNSQKIEDLEMKVVALEKQINQLLKYINGDVKYMSPKPIQQVIKKVEQACKDHNYDTAMRILE